MYINLRRHGFLFEELVKRDFKKKYKRTILGVGWSLLSPLLMLLVMKVVFSQFFGAAIEHYTTYLFCGNLLFMYFSESTNEGMACLRHNAAIFTKINVPKYIFPLAKNVQTLLNFVLTLAVFFVFCLLDGVDFSWRFLLLAYPIATDLYDFKGTITRGGTCIAFDREALLNRNKVTGPHKALDGANDCKTEAIPVSL